jgi:Uma2 family endonuclease
MAPMEAVLESHGKRMSGPEFRVWLETRPDRERWELIDGERVMMTPPTISHNVIASNLERLLNSTLRAGGSMIAVQGPGLILAGQDTRPEPDVVVIDKNYKADEHYIDRAYLLVEVVSSSDRVRLPGTRKQQIDRKRECYREHEPCIAILVISQEAMAVDLELRSNGVWKEQKLTAADVIQIPELGFECSVSALYQNTPLEPQSKPEPVPPAGRTIK